MQWDERWRRFRSDVIDNEPIAKLDENGEIVLEVSEEYRRILEDMRAAGRHEARKCVLWASVLLVVVLVAASAITAVSPELEHAARFVVMAFALGGALCVYVGFERKRKAQWFYDHLEGDFKSTAEEMVANHEYYMVAEDGTIIWDEPWDLENDLVGYLEHLEERLGPGEELEGYLKYLEERWTIPKDGRQA